MFFRAKTPPEETVGMLGTEVGALFRYLSSYLLDVHQNIAWFQWVSGSQRKFSG
jgi:hypothetical protein